MNKKLLNNTNVTNNLVNSSIDEYRGNLSNFLNNECVNIYVTWYRGYNDILFKNQIISGNHSKIVILGAVYGALLQKLCLRTRTRQGLQFRWYERKITRSVNGENAVKTG